MSDKYSSAYSEALRKNREKEKREQRRFEMKEKVKSFIPRNPFRAKAKENEGIRTSSKFSRQIISPGNRPRNVVYVTEKVNRYNDLNLTDKTRNEELNKAERRIEQDPDMRKYYYKYAQETLGGMPTAQEKKETKTFLNDAIANYPNSRDQQNRFAVANFMVTKYDLYRNIIINSGADKSYQKWYRKYVE
tara:strand:- start:89 stop:658 length:570 start_codon:yes stop_codon:yes gene_type:complete